MVQSRMPGFMRPAVYMMPAGQMLIGGTGEKNVSPSGGGATVSRSFGPSFQAAPLRQQAVSTGVIPTQSVAPTPLQMMPLQTLAPMNPVTISPVGPQQVPVLVPAPSTIPWGTIAIVAGVAIAAVVAYKVVTSGSSTAPLRSSRSVDGSRTPLLSDTEASVLAE